MQSQAWNRYLLTCDPAPKERDSGAPQSQSLLSLNIFAVDIVGYILRTVPKVYIGGTINHPFSDSSFR